MFKVIMPYTEGKLPGICVQRIKTARRMLFQQAEEAKFTSEVMLYMLDDEGQVCFLILCNGS